MYICHVIALAALIELWARAEALLHCVASRALSIHLRSPEPLCCDVDCNAVQ